MPSEARTTVSIGVASFPDQRIHSPETFLALADGALYRAKAQGRDRVALAQGEDTTADNS